MPVHDGLRYRVTHERATVVTRANEEGDVQIEASPFGGKTTVEILSAEGDILATGVATCHPTLDRWDRKRGHQIALGRAVKAFWERGLTKPPEEETRTSWTSFADIAQREFVQLLSLAFREADRDGFCYVHFADDEPASFIVITPDRYDQICERIFRGGTIPPGDPEWSHSHVSPEMTRDENVTGGVH